METNKDKKEGIEEQVKRVVKPIFDRVLKEASPNHRMVGSSQKPNLITFYWQPHNHRLYFPFNKQNFNQNKPPNHTLKKYKSMVPTFNTAYTYTSLNYDSEHQYKEFMFCTIKVKKNQVEVINHWHKKQWRKIEAESIEDVSKRIDEVMQELKDRSIQALKVFIELHGGYSNFQQLRERCEHGLHGDDYLDKIPTEMVIHDTNFKKTYKRKVEMPTITEVKTYISNRAVEQIAPPIANSLNELHGIIDKLVTDLVPTITDLNENTKSHLSLIKGIDNSFKKFNSLLSQRSLKDWLK